MLFETRLSFVENSEHPSRLAAVVLSFWSSTLQHALIHPFTWANEVSASGKLNTQVIRSQVSCPNNGNYVRLRWWRVLPVSPSSLASTLSCPSAPCQTLDTLRCLLWPWTPMHGWLKPLPWCLDTYHTCRSLCLSTCFMKLSVGPS